MSNLDPQRRLWPKMMLGIENQRIGVGNDLNCTLVSNLQLDLFREGLKIVHDAVPFLADVERQVPRLEGAVQILLTARNIEEAAKSVGIAPNTLLNWMKVPEFRAAYREARRAAYSQAVAKLQQGTTATATTLLKVMLDQSTPASVKVRAAECVMSHSANAIEIEDIEARVAELEIASPLPRCSLTCHTPKATATACASIVPSRKTAPSSSPTTPRCGSIAIATPIPKTPSITSRTSAKPTSNSFATCQSKPGIAKPSISGPCSRMASRRF